MRRRWPWRRRPQADYVDHLKRWYALPPDNETHQVTPLDLPAIQPLKAQREVSMRDRFRVGRK
jgi:hypothetical protein